MTPTFLHSMNRHFQRLAVLATLASALLAGCATGPRREKNAARPGQTTVEKRQAKKAADADGQL